ncbi:hypothetical protein K7459_19975 [Pseudomonas fluorescens]|uniref:Putative exported protein n=1 Tax=Pseudomonas fluorescens (strain Pf0-1) TaxID=205922 RepID=Q3KD32_PSEPF|nr:hypothetical protein [Pseudomonas fluorescens]ABA74323.1 putative exported protein [Pseudomonas fluorescens Pf0-1]MBY9025948.1 hypothetical protein [Pseudomonas fluorescens]MBY9031246.1 hypothetical protein [Pseudomonas fluorescens]MBY9037766.1 hypothetical protein [Pseudomonas fluorescens]MBY9041359.1 hypothetical protein [Pseudomonas fluorescens]
MKTTTAILAGLLTLASASAFAEGGAERMRHYWANFPVHSAQSQQAEAKTHELKVPDDQTAQVTESYLP